jgi:glycyl-tRNA synthetase beta chain
MQPKAAEDLRRLLTDGLVEAGLTYAHAAAFATPRRLALTVEELSDRSRPVARSARAPPPPRPKPRSRASCAPPASPSTSSSAARTRRARPLRRHRKPGREAAEIVAEVWPA